MNKKIIFFVMIFLLTGCSDTLKCERSLNEEEKKAKITFQENEISEAVLIENRFFDKNDAHLDLYYYEQKNYLESLEISSGLTFQVVDHKDKVTTHITLDFTTLNQDISAIMPLKKKMSKQEVKEVFESQAYSCK